MPNVQSIVEQYRGVVSWRKDVTPADPAFYKKLASWRGSFRFEVQPETAAEYREWCHENARLREEQIARVLALGYKLQVTSDQATLAYTGQAHAAYWPMPDGGLAVRITSPTPTEALLRVSWVVEKVAAFDLSRLQLAAAPDRYVDPWAD